MTHNKYADIESYLKYSTGTPEKPGWRFWPVYEKKDEILKCMKANNVIIAKSGTGSGKTVLLPKLMLHALGYSKPIVCTVPKRILAQEAAEFAALCLDVKVGEHVGYYYKGKKKLNENGIQTKLIFTTIGSLKSRLTGNNSDLSEYGAIIVDEAHERSVATDFTFLLLKQLVQRKSDIKILIMSATLDEIRFRDYYSVGKVKVGIINVGEKTKFHIDDIYEKKEISQKDLEKTIINKVIHILQTTDDGAILVFIKSGGEGNSLCQKLQQECKVLGLRPFCTELSSKGGDDKHPKSGISKKDYAIKLNLWKDHPNQNKNHPYERKIVMTTNVAESSLTIEDAVYVVDTGKELTDRYNPTTMSRSLKDEWISKSAATQRRGRAGRTMAGVCYHLYTKKQYDNLKDFPTPDIQKTDLSTEILDLMKTKGVLNVGDLNTKLNELMEPPEESFRISGLRILEALGAITNINNDGILTPLGLAISEFRAIEPIHARALISSYQYYCKEDVIDIISMLQLSDSRMDSVFMKPRDKAYLKEFEKVKKSLSSEYGDFFTLLKIYRLYQKESNKIKNIKGGNNSKTTILNEEAEEALYNNNGKLILTNNQFKPTVKKWCEKNFISYRLLKRIASNSKQISRILNQVMRDYNSKIQKYKNNQTKNKNLELLLKEMESEIKANESYDIRRNGKGYLELSTTKKTALHSNILRALLDGYKIHICKKVGKKYNTCFPSKSSSCNINQDSSLKSTSTYIIYNELFDMGSVKLNMVNKLTEQILRDPKLKSSFERCKNIKNSSSKKTKTSKKHSKKKFGTINKIRKLSKKHKKMYRKK